MVETHSQTADQPRVSIITIVYNGVKEIRQTLDSVLQQNYASVEYIVIDGGSSDGTVDILREYSPQLAWWVSEADGGISDAFNKGIERASGDIIGLINSGDWYEPTAVGEVVDIFLDDRNLGVVCGKVQFWKGEKREYLCSSVPQLLEKEMTVAHPSCFVRSDLYRRVGLFSTEYTLAMDYELLLRMKRHGAKFLSLESVLANMKHEGISEEHWFKALRETHRARNEILKGSFYASPWYFYFICSKRYIRILLERFGMTSLLRFYRSRLALVKKSKVGD